MIKQTHINSTPWGGFTRQFYCRIVIEPDLHDGGYVVHCPALKGCWSQGETINEALHHIVDAISGWLAVHIELETRA